MLRIKGLKIQEILFLLMSIVYISLSVIPILSEWVGLPLGTINLITFGVLFLLCPIAFLNKTAIWCFIYALVLYVYLTMGKDFPSLSIGDYPSRQIFLIEMAYILPNIAVFSLLFHYNNRNIYKYLTISTLFFIIIAFVYFTPLILLFPNALRSTVENYDGTKVELPGLPRYALCHAYIMVFPALLYAVTIFKKKAKWLMIFIAAYFFFVIYSTYIATCLFIAVGVIFYVFFVERSKHSSGRTVFFILVLLLFILHILGVIEALLDFLVETTDGSALHGKMVTIHDALYGKLQGGGSFEDRSNLHQESWDAFFRNMMVGSLPVGGHSSLLDRLGGFGLFGFLPFLFMLISFFKKVSKNHKTKSARQYFIIGFCTALVLLYQKGLFGQECWLFFIVLLPCFMFYFEERAMLNNTK